MNFGKELTPHATPIPGLIWFDLPVHGDSRGWFKENWQREKMTTLGLPDFGPVQNNVSFNAKKGVIRGIHAEPWDKYISVGAGRIFGAWVDLRKGDSFGAVFSIELDASKAVFVPHGVGNSFQALEDDTVYTYLVNDHWSAEAQSQYTFLNPADSTVAIDWPIPLDKAELSEKDRTLPNLSEVHPMDTRKTLIIGSNGQLGQALKVEFPDAECVTRDSFDITDPSILTARRWKNYETIINAAAYTDVDTAETPEGKRNAWLTNSTAVNYLTKIANNNHITLVHISSDYVFDGKHKLHEEGEAFSPLSVYGQTKVAGDLIVSTTPRHYIVRTSWVIGEGNNFVNTMLELAKKGVEPNVVNDQVGRLTFASDLAKAVKHLLASKAQYGTFNMSNDGELVSWADIASLIFELSGHNPKDVRGITTKDYQTVKRGAAPRPLHSALNIVKIKNTGFAPRDWQEALKEYIQRKDSQKE